jgi:hypothetical protein
MSDLRSVTSPLSWPKAAIFIAIAVVPFHPSYLATHIEREKKPEASAVPTA